MNTNKTNYRKMYDKNEKESVEVENQNANITETEAVMNSDTKANEEITSEVIKNKDIEDSEGETNNRFVNQESEETEGADIYNKFGRITNCIGLNVRKEPSLNSDIIGVLYVSTKFKIIDICDDFYQVQVYDKNLIGYCLKAYIDIEK